MSDLRRRGKTPVRATSHHSHRHTREDSQSFHHTRETRNDDPLLKELKAQNRVLQEKEELIRHLQEQLKANERGTCIPPPRGQQSRPRSPDLRQVLNDRRRDRCEEEGSSSSHLPSNLSGSRREPESPRPENMTGLRELLDHYVKREVQARMADIGFARDQAEACDAEDQGMFPFS